jgi:hypothetical protein
MQYSSLLGPFTSFEENEVLQIRPLGLYYKTYYSCNFRIFEWARVFVCGKHFQPSPMFAGKAGAYPQTLD